MQDISDILLQIMETTHCNCFTALMYLKGDENVSNALLVPKSVSESDVPTNKSTDSESAR